jgi:hypothetical protein
MGLNGFPVEASKRKLGNRTIQPLVFFSMLHSSRLLLATCIACLIAPSLVTSRAVGQLSIRTLSSAAEPVMGEMQPAQIAAQPATRSDSSDRADGWFTAGFNNAAVVGVVVLAVGSIAIVLLVIRRDAAYKIHNRQQANISQPVSGLPANLQSSSLLEDGEVKPDQLSDNGSAQPLDLDESQLVRSSVPPFSETTRLAKVDIVEALITDLHSLEPDNRRKAIWELGQRGDSRAIQPLVDLLMDSDSAQRSLILAAVSEIGVRSLKPLTRGLMLSIQDDSPDVRKNAIRDVTRLCDVVTQVSQLLQYAASDTDPEVRDTAQWALGQLSRIRSLPDESSAGSSTAATSRSEEASSDGA